MSLKHASNRFQPRAQDVTGQVGWKVVGTVVSLAVTTNTVAIGADTMVGTEKVRIVGLLRLDDATNNLAGIELTDGDSLPISAAGSARIRYDGASNTLQASTNAGAWMAFGPSGWTDTGTVVRLVTLTDTVAIGVAAMVGTEKLRITGDTLQEGNFYFGSATANPILYQADLVTVAGTGQTLTIHAQDETGGGASVGGALNIRAGHGVTHGILSLLDADGVTGRVIVDAAGNVTNNGAVSTILQIAGSNRFAVYNGEIAFYPSLVYWTAATASPTLYHYDDATVAATGDVFLIHAQDMTGGGASVGGALYLRPGHGVTHGVLSLLDADGTSRVTISAANNVTINGATYTELLGAGTQAIVCYSTLVSVSVPLLQFGAAAASPSFIQADLATVAGTGQTMLIHAQDEIGGGASVGGALNIRAGHGVTHGVLNLEDAGGTPRITIQAGDTILMNGNGAIYMQVSSQYIAVLDAISLYMYKNIIRFLPSVLTPSIYHDDDATLGATGQTFTIHAQDETGGGASVGGAFNIRAGNGTTQGALSLTDALGTARIQINGTGLGFFNTAPIAKPNVAGVKVDVVAGAIVVALAALGLVTNSTT